MARLHLAAGPLRVEIEPGIGGSIARFDHVGSRGRQALLRGSDRYESVLDAGCFPLVPFANRIRGGRFLCNGREIVLAPNMAGDRIPLHGQGWLASWQVARSDEVAAELVYRHAAGEWPWDYEARQQLQLDDTGLTVRVSCRNLSVDPMPCALGLHPYYPCNADTRLDTGVTSAWTIDADVLPVDNVPASGRYDLRDRLVCGQDLDNGFDGWSGRARINWPDQEVALLLTSADAGRFQLYSPSEGGIFVAEPVQNANAALNEPQERWAELGIEMLGQGEERGLAARFSIVAA